MSDIKYAIKKNGKNKFYKLEGMGTGVWESLNEAYLFSNPFQAQRKAKEIKDAVVVEIGLINLGVKQ